jgi:hypothetical protein
MINEDFVLGRVQSLLLQYAKARGALRPPINPEDMVNLCAVRSVEHRQMVPEGVLTVVPGGFKIYLQDNFTNQSGMKLRKRFTLAHELAHTFFYELNHGVPTPVKNSPKGQKLEALCHVGASEILVPKALLKRELEVLGEVASAEYVLDLAKVFDVSVEVIMRRLHKLELIASEKFAAILVKTIDGIRLIEASCYGSMLLCNATAPKRGLEFDSWVRQLLPPSGRPQDSDWVRATQSATIRAKKVRRSSRSFILDLKFDPPGS